MKRAIHKVKLSSIRIDGGTQCRKNVDPHWVSGMVDNMKMDIEYDPVEARFDGSTYWLTDGFHRYHAYTQLGIKEINVAYLPGTQFDAQLDALLANSKHGKPLTREDKENKVRMALNNPLITDKSDSVIAKLCDVSKPFVGAIRRPETKQKQVDAKKQHILKKAQEIRENTEEKDPSGRNPITPDSSQTTSSVPMAGEFPDEAELLANQRKQEADMEMVAKMLDADDKMAHLFDENKRLTHLVVMKDLRIKELMNEKSAAVKMVKDLQKQLDKLRK